MWTRKAAFTFTGGIALVLIGMMISNQQMMILGLSLVAFIVVNSWVSGHGDVEVQRTLSADNVPTSITSEYHSTFPRAHSHQTALACAKSSRDFSASNLL